MPLGRTKVSTILPLRFAFHFFSFPLLPPSCCYCCNSLLIPLLCSLIFFSLYFFHHLGLHTSNLALKSNLFFSGQWTSQWVYVWYSLGSFFNNVFQELSILPVSVLLAQAFYMLLSYMKIGFYVHEALLCFRVYKHYEFTLFRQRVACLNQGRSLIFWKKFTKINNFLQNGNNGGHGEDNL